MSGYAAIFCVFFGLTAGIAPLGAVAFGADAGGIGTVGAGSTAPEFSCKTVLGETLSLEKLLAERKVILLNFWGLRCGACIEEIPHLNALSGKFGNRLRILGVNVDGVDGESLKGYMARMDLKMEYTVVPDPDLAMADRFQMTAAPFNVVIDPQGIIKGVHENYVEGDEVLLERAIREALGQPVQPRDKGGK